jgi:hypothetical protein
VRARNRRLPVIEGQHLLVGGDGFADFAAVEVHAFDLGGEQKLLGILGE